MYIDGGSQKGKKVLYLKRQEQTFDKGPRKKGPTPNKILSFLDNESPWDLGTKTYILTSFQTTKLNSIIVRDAMYLLGAGNLQSTVFVAF